MLRFPRRRVAGAGSFKPRKDGPLIAGTPVGNSAESSAGTRTEASSENGAPARPGEAIGETVGAGVEGAGGICPPGTPEGLAAVSTLPGTSASSVAPHIPQKRLVTGLSLPQRAQRKHP